MDEAEDLPLLALCLVRGVQPFERAGDDTHGAARRDALARLAGLPDQPRERLAGDVLHDEEELAVVRDDVEGGDHVRVADTGREARLLQEHRHEIRVLREVRMEALDGHRAREADRPEQARKMDRGHAAGCDLAVQRVPPQASAEIRAGLLRHLVRELTIPARALKAAGPAMIHDRFRARDGRVTPRSACRSGRSGLRPRHA